jgi:hypothetical protein
MLDVLRVMERMINKEMPVLYAAPETVLSHLSLWCCRAIWCGVPGAVLESLI